MNLARLTIDLKQDEDLESRATLNKKGLKEVVEVINNTVDCVEELALAHKQHVKEVEGMLRKMVRLVDSFDKRLKALETDKDADKLINMAKKL